MSLKIIPSTYKRQRNLRDNSECKKMCYIALTFAIPTMTEGVCNPRFIGYMICAAKVDWVMGVVGVVRWQVEV